MGSFAKKIISMDIPKWIKFLNKAFADEWLAYYQYWIGAKIAKGPMKSSIVAELEQHATDELRHAQILANRIIQLGGTPIIEPKDWYKFSGCGYTSPKNPHVTEILKQNIKGEQCAIETYNKIIKTIKDKDFVTYNIIIQILTDEVEHEEDLENLLEDIKLIK